MKEIGVIRCAYLLGLSLRRSTGCSYLVGVTEVGSGWRWWLMWAPPKGKLSGGNSGTTRLMMMNGKLGLVGYSLGSIWA